MKKNPFSTLTSLLLFGGSTFLIGVLGLGSENAWAMNSGDSSDEQACDAIMAGMVENPTITHQHNAKPWTLPNADSAVVLEQRLLQIQWQATHPSKIYRFLMRDGRIIKGRIKKIGLTPDNTNPAQSSPSLDSWETSLDLSIWHIHFTDFPILYQLLSYHFHMGSDLRDQLTITLVLDDASTPESSSQEAAIETTISSPSDTGSSTPHIPSSAPTGAPIVPDALDAIDVGSFLPTGDGDDNSDVSTNGKSSAPASSTATPSPIRATPNHSEEFIDQPTPVANTIITLAPNIVIAKQGLIPRSPEEILLHNRKIEDARRQQVTQTEFLDMLLNQKKTTLEALTYLYRTFSTGHIPDATVVDSMKKFYDVKELTWEHLLASAQQPIRSALPLPSVGDSNIEPYYSSDRNSFIKMGAIIPPHNCQVPALLRRFSFSVDRLIGALASDIENDFGTELSQSIQERIALLSAYLFFNTLHLHPSYDTNFRTSLYFSTVYLFKKLQHMSGRSMTPYLLPVLNSLNSDWNQGSGTSFSQSTKFLYQPKGSRSTYYAPFASLENLSQSEREKVKSAKDILFQHRRSELSHWASAVPNSVFLSWDESEKASPLFSEVILSSNTAVKIIEQIPDDKLHPGFDTLNSYFLALFNVSSIDDFKNDPMYASWAKGIMDLWREGSNRSSVIPRRND